MGWNLRIVPFHVTLHFDLSLYVTRSLVGLLSGGGLRTPGDQRRTTRGLRAGPGAARMRRPHGPRQRNARRRVRRAGATMNRAQRERVTSDVSKLS